MTVGPYAGAKVSEAKPKIRDEMVAAGQALPYSEPEKTVRCFWGVLRFFAVFPLVRCALRLCFCKLLCVRLCVASRLQTPLSTHTPQIHLILNQKPNHKTNKPKRSCRAPATSASSR
jgi:hypothetical protein